MPDEVWEGILLAGAAGAGLGLGLVFAAALVRVVRRFMKGNGDTPHK